MVRGAIQRGQRVESRHIGTADPAAGPRLRGKQTRSSGDRGQPPQQRPPTNVNTDRARRLTVVEETAGNVLAGIVTQFRG
ncbi:hypothetical protein KRMM14A1259_46460 [Krasilnikovia sp. MM14-A1259]